MNERIDPLWLTKIFPRVQFSFRLQISCIRFLIVAFRNQLLTRHLVNFLTIDYFCFQFSVRLVVVYLYWLCCVIFLFFCAVPLSLLFVVVGLSIEFVYCSVCLLWYKKKLSVTYDTVHVVSKELSVYYLLYPPYGRCLTTVSD